ncbi:MAG: tyrosine--tRNA ligase [Ferrovibrionaceae bacterium]
MTSLDLIAEDCRSELLRTLAGRGFIHQLTDAGALDAVLAGGVVPAYVGFDATADSLHVGHLLSIMSLRWLQRCGHKPIVLIGGGTTRIGDPSFRDQGRPLLDDAAIARNIAGIREVFGRYLVFGDGPTDAIMVDNADWLDRLAYIPFLRDVGRHFSVNRMLSFDSVRLRLEREQTLSFLEFNYMILQAYDFLELARRHGCVLQMGGSDQWGNIVNGVELARRVDGRELHGLTTPLLTNAAGAKMGKTAAGALWLNAERLSPYDFWQFWRDCADADVGRFLRLFTDLPLAEIARLEALQGAELNEAKKRLADEATALAHGREAAASAAETARAIFEGGGAGADLPRLVVTPGAQVIDLLVAGGLAASRGEARRAVRGGGVRLGDVIVGDETAVVQPAATPLWLSFGRKRHVLLVEG